MARLLRNLPLLGALILLVACATKPSPTPAPSPEPPAPMQSCASGGVLLDAHFDGGQLGQCQGTGDGSFEITLYPEDAPPINASPWYAMRASGKAGDELSIHMTVADGKNRYWPKVSVDGDLWQPAPDEWLSWGEDYELLTISAQLDGPVLWITGQELITDAWFQDWQTQLISLDGFTTRVAGQSLEGRPIYRTENADRDEFVLLIGRQHPPEITGSLAMEPFIAEITGDSELAVRFRERYKLVIFPLLNPDGVANGYWRHNSGGVDLNRDWGPFTQPETRIVLDDVNELVSAGMTPVLMLDFHSTQKNLFYTQLEEEPTVPEAFATRWLNASAQRLPDYEFLHDARGVSERPTTKNYFYTRFGIPAITYETGDETDRDSIEQSARVFAQEMMILLLEEPAQP